MAGFIAQAATGALFWLLAARHLPSDTVGLAAALFATLQAVNYLTALGLQETLARYQPWPGHRTDPLFAWSAVATTATSVVGVTVLLLVADTQSLDAFRAVFSWGSPLVLIGISALAAIALLADVRWIGANRPSVVALRLFLVGVVRLPLLWIVGGADPAVWLFLTMAAPIAVSGLVSLLALPSASGHSLSLGRPEQPLGDIVRYSGVNYLGHLALQAPQFLLPFIVLLNVGPTENANFFIAWTIVSVVAILPVTISRVLLVSVSRKGADVEAQARLAMAYSMVVVLGAFLASLAARAFVQSFFGESYGTVADVLPLMTVAGFPWAFIVVVLGYLRARHDHLGTVLLTSVLGLTIVGIAVVQVPREGIEGAVQAWILGNLIAAILAIPLGLRALRMPRRREELDAIGDVGDLDEGHGAEGLDGSDGPVWADG